MSVRAYKVLVPAVLETNPSFNLWHDESLLDFFRENGETWESENDDSRFELTVKTIKKALKNYKWDKDDYRIKQLEKDIKGLPDDEWVCYQCF